MSGRNRPIFAMAPMYEVAKNEPNDKSNHSLCPALRVCSRVLCLRHIHRTKDKNQERARARPRCRLVKIQKTGLTKKRSLFLCLTVVESKLNVAYGPDAPSDNGWSGCLASEGVGS